MNQQDKQEPNNQQPLIEDLTVNEGDAAEVTGGGSETYLQIKLKDALITGYQ
jgi:hypothetical protein